VVTVESIAGVTRLVRDETARRDVAVAQLAPADAVGVLAADAMWDLDERGYNFRDDLPAAVFSDADHVYRIEYRVTPAGDLGDPWTFAAVLPAEEVLCQ
jgi:hypothetical protein